jgi:hypothetical protein
MRRVISLLGIVAPLLTGGLAVAQQASTPPLCDFLTGGGFIVTTASSTHDPAKANFGVGGGCKDGSPTWGHLEYIDHGTGLNVHWTSITSYFISPDLGPDTPPDQPNRTRMICGTARSNAFGDVDWFVRATDNGNPGNTDEFVIRVSKGGVIVYSTEFDVSPQNDTLVGGNIQLHEPNPSNTGTFGGNCSALAAVCTSISPPNCTTGGGID